MVYDRKTKRFFPSILKINLSTKTEISKERNMNISYLFMHTQAQITTECLGFRT